MKKKYYFNIKNAYLLLMIIVAGCEKSTTIGDDLFGNENLNIATLDTFTIQTTSVKIDSFDTRNQSVLLLGSMFHNELGTIKAHAYMQPDLSTNNLVYPGGSILGLDSVILTLDYANYYGDTIQAQSFKVYEITDNFDATASFNQNSVLAFNPTPIGVLNNLNIQPVKNMYIGGDTLQAHIRIPLSYSFGFGLLSLSGTNFLANAANFHSIFKGIYVETQNSPSGRCMLSIAPRSSQTGITLYYHSESADSLSYTFRFTSNNGVFYNQYEHNYNGNLNAADVGAYCQNTDNDSLVYMQGSEGPSMRVSFPNLEQSQNMLVNKAVLEVYAMPLVTDTLYSYPTYLTFETIESSNCEINVASFGKKTTKVINGTTVDAYQFTITTIVQSQIDNNSTNDYLIRPYTPLNYPSGIAPNVVSALNKPNAYAIPVYGGSHSAFAPRLFVSFTEIN